MRWLAFFILAYLVLAVQVGLGDFLAVKRATPNFVLIAVIFVAVNANGHSGLWGAFLLGLFQDLLTVQPLGLYAFSYGLAGLIVSGSKQVAYGGHPITHFLLTLGGGLVTAVVLSVHGWFRPPLDPLTLTTPALVLPALGFAPGPFFLSALYTAVVSPFVLWGLNKTRPLFGFRAAAGATVLSLTRRPGFPTFLSTPIGRTGIARRIAVGFDASEPRSPHHAWGCAPRS